MSAYTSISRLYTFTPATTILPAEVNAELTQLVNASNTKIDKDGSSAFSGHVALKDSSPTNALHAASKGYVDAQDAATLVDSALTGSTTIANINSCTTATITTLTTADLNTPGGTLEIAATSVKLDTTGTAEIDLRCTTIGRFKNSEGDVTITPKSAKNVVFETGGGGYLLIQNIPVAAGGLPAGAVWSNGGVLTIV